MCSASPASRRSSCWKASTTWDSARRLAVNDWIRHSHAFDGVIDFANLVAYPGHPNLLDPKYDSGDHLHPNDAGFQAMADAVFHTLTSR